MGPLWVCSVCSLAGVEALVGWLLDHADAQVTDLSDADTGSEDCSDEEVMEDFDDMAYAMVSGSGCHPHACAHLSAVPGASGPLQRALCSPAGHTGALWL